ncbi:uncharacterized protein LOC106763375 [Vigna radiata var. radiata]|uniref:Uncharacterized protein LOC106763375 n=1 Tax=Vigna radiata var. radiata TaxID=3916 RepID=A0A1S3UAK2_VIGRR|nr:uncharacterized protein LOC106763375 [Vigna radiata var. radiata]
MAASDNETFSERGTPSQPKGVFQLQPYDALLAQNKIITQQLEILTKKFRSNNYNQGWRSQPSNGPGQFGQTGGQYYKPPQQQQQQWQQQPSSDKTAQLQETLNQFMQATHSNQKNAEAAIRNLETQMGQLNQTVNQMQEKSYKNFRANTDVNPKEECKNTRKIQAGCLEEVSKRLGIEVPMTEALQQIPTYKEFLNKLLKKKNLKEETTEEQRDCSVMLQKTLPPKEGDPRSFTIPCNIGEHKIRKALIDLGSNINLMPLTFLKKMGELEVKPARMSLLMANGSPKRPYGVLENVKLQVDNLMFLVDFAILEMVENAEIPINLGRPFLKTAKVIINVDEGTIALKDQEDKVILNACKTRRQIEEKKTNPKAAFKDALGKGTRTAKSRKKGKKYFLS